MIGAFSHTEAGGHACNEDAFALVPKLRFYALPTTIRATIM